MGTAHQRLAAWCGIAFVVIFGLGLGLIAGFIPPPSPDNTPEETAAIFRDDANRIHTGLLVALIAAPLMFPWVVVISLQMRRIEDPRSPVLALTQLISGSAGVLVFVLPIMVLQTAAFRAGDQDPSVTAALNDLAWLTVVATFSMAVVQGLAIAVAIFRDNSPVPVFPRWVGYFNVWTVLLFVPGGLAVYFRTGPFAWDGVFAWWIPLTVFGVWFVVMFVALRGAIDQEADRAPSAVQRRSVPTEGEMTC